MGIETGVAKDTTALLYALESGRQEYRDIMDLPTVKAIGKSDSEGARYFLGVLRRIMVGNVFTAEREFRHASLDKIDTRNLTDECKCVVGGAHPSIPPATVQHVLWECSLGDELRADALRVLEECGLRLSDLPVCFRYALLWPEEWQPPRGARRPTTTQIARMQIAITKALQKHWHGDSDDYGDEDDHEEGP